jgi:glycosyltransferase involved in cell wall biosynthesis
MKPTLTVIVPALNEEANIRAATQTIQAAIDDRFSDYEILIFNDGSNDNTGAIAEELSKKNEKIRVIHNERTMGFGYNYRKGVELARFDYIVMLPGDNEISEESIKKIFNSIGKADIVIPYTLNPEVRPLLRRIISRFFTTVLNLSFGLRIRYYNGPVIHKSKIIKSVPIVTSGYAYQAETLVQLLKSGLSYVEVGMNINQRRHGTTKAFALKNIISVFLTFFRLVYNIHVKRGEATFLKNR